MRGDPLVVILILLGGAMICLIFIPRWAFICRRLIESPIGYPRHLWHRFWAWAMPPCGCKHCVAARQLVENAQWERFIGAHQELQPPHREKAS